MVIIPTRSSYLKLPMMQTYCTSLLGHLSNTWNITLFSQVYNMLLFLKCDYQLTRTVTVHLTKTHSSMHVFKPLGHLHDWGIWLTKCEYFRQICNQKSTYLARMFRPISMHTCMGGFSVKRDVKLCSVNLFYIDSLRIFNRFVHKTWVCPHSQQIALYNE